MEKRAPLYVLCGALVGGVVYLAVSHRPHPASAPTPQSVAVASQRSIQQDPTVDLEPRVSPELRREGVTGAPQSAPSPGARGVKPPEQENTDSAARKQSGSPPLSRPGSTTARTVGSAAPQASLKDWAPPSVGPTVQEPPVNVSASSSASATAPEEALTNRQSLIANIPHFRQFASTHSTAAAELLANLGYRKEGEPEVAFIGGLDAVAKKCQCAEEPKFYYWDLAEGIRQFTAERGRPAEVEQFVRESESEVQVKPLSQAFEWVQSGHPLLATFCHGSQARRGVYQATLDQTSWTVCVVGATRKEGGPAFVYRDGDGELTAVDPASSSYTNVVITLVKVR